jgi:hypothetical protein
MPFSLWSDTEGHCFFYCRSKKSNDPHTASIFITAGMAAGGTIAVAAVAAAVASAAFIVLKRI